ncbi:hypothetical protein [Paenibacillus woosongensis]|uniref:Uncharacterized protein n=1 Tax=Paenibacillus woosongensis TaxID=307580 RepID=A0ABQ4MPG5_9BACL|nr:hypothetical protein [Paenibacillus woosongensis]GIP57915.1 hypothetical protein J15TS10_17290 [Paenibacillus woosongensis]
MATTIEELQILITAKTAGLQKVLGAVKDKLTGAEKAAKSATATVDAQGQQAADTSKKLADLTAALDNTNTQIELQKQKISELKAKQEGLTAKAQQQMQALEQESAGLEEQIRSTTERLEALKAEQGKAMSPIHADMINEEIKEVENALNELISKADEVGNKMADLDDAGDSTKMKQKIARAEGALLSLQRRADKTKESIEKLMSDPVPAAKKTEKAVKSVNNAVEKTGGTAKRSSNAFVQGFKRIAKQVLVFAVIYKTISGLNRYIGANLKTNAQFVASLNAIKTNLAVAFQPIYSAILPALNALMGFLAKVTAYIAAFISAVFGTTYKKSYEAAKGIESAKKAMAGYGKAAKKSGKEAKLALAGFDELNTLDFSNGADDASGGGADKGFTMEMPDMDIDGIQSKMDSLVAGIKSTFDKAWAGVKQGWDWTVKTFGPSFQAAWGEISPELEKWKQQFGNMFTDVMTLGEPLKNWFHERLVPFWQDGIQLAGHVWAGLLDSILSIVTSVWDAVFPIWEKLISEGLPRFTEFLKGVQEIFGKLFDLAKQIFDDIWQDVIDPAMQFISQIIKDALDIIFEWWDTWGKKIVDGLKDSLDKIKELWTNIWENFLKPFITKILDKLKEIWDNHLKDLIKEIGNFIGKLVTAAQDIFNKFIMPIVNWLVEKLGPIFVEIFDGILNVIGEALGGIIDAAKGIIKALGGIVDFVAGVFTGDWEKAWEGIKTFFSGIGEALGSIFKGAINQILEAFNFMIRQVNKVNFKLPDWIPGDLGGKEFGLSIPEVPKLDVGTNYVARDGLAYLHEGEAVVPKKYNPAAGGAAPDNKETNALLKQLIQAVKESGTVVIGRDSIGRAAVGYMNDYQKQTGQPAISL